MIERFPAPGSRREHFRFRDGTWATLMSQQNAALLALLTDAGITVAGEQTPAGRLEEMRDLHGYMLQETPGPVEGWHRARSR